jgi:hypothetical protein
VTSGDTNFNYYAFRRSQTTDYLIGLHEYPITILRDTSLYNITYTGVGQNHGNTTDTVDISLL